MNIFILDSDPIKAAQMQCDRHVVKMTLESCQMICSAVIMNGGIAPYKLAHKHHPCTIWTAKNIENFTWLYFHGMALSDEYTNRFGKIHKCKGIMQSMFESSLIYIPDGKQSDFPQAMPEKYKNADPVVAYRAYYKGEKSGFAKWTKRDKPDWFDV